MQDCPSESMGICVIRKKIGKKLCWTHLRRRLLIREFFDRRENGLDMGCYGLGLDLRL